MLGVGGCRADSDIRYTVTDVILRFSSGLLHW